MHIDAPYPVFNGPNAYKWLQKWVADKQFDQCFIVTDEMVSVHCLQSFLDQTAFELPCTPMIIPAGEIHKNLETASGIWRTLLEHRASRNSLIIALGGGVITDLCGFVASTYKRGMEFISVPTTLLAQVDAAFGGKTGIDFNGIKNSIGTFQNPGAVLVDPHFLRTLSQREMRSGWAEMIKYSWVADAELWAEFKAHSWMDFTFLESWIYRCINLKNAIVADDPRESGRRKCLNFGHTAGHAIEAQAMDNADTEAILHGEAVAAGMIMEAFLSVRYAGLPESNLHELVNLLAPFFPPIELRTSWYPDLLERMENDKKNTHGELRLTLVPEIGSCTPDCPVSPHDLIEAMEFYRTLGYPSHTDSSGVQGDANSNHT